MLINKIVVGWNNFNHENINRFVGTTEPSKNLAYSSLSYFAFLDRKYITYDMRTTTTANFTINHNRRINYLILESNLNNGVNGFGNTYWFLTPTVSIESRETVTYSAVLDVFTTHGEKFLNSLKSPFYINRKHENRYNLQGDNLNINPNFCALWNSDFKLEDTLNQFVSYETADYSQPQPLPDYKYLKKGVSMGYCDNSVTDGVNVWYKYAIIEASGEPNSILNDNGDVVTIQHYLSLYNNTGIGFDGFRMVLPVGKQLNNISPLGTSSEWNSFADISTISKIVNIFLSPTKLEPDRGITIIGEKSKLEQFKNSANPETNENLFYAFDYNTFNNNTISSPTYLSTNPNNFLGFKLYKSLDLSTFNKDTFTKLINSYSFDPALSHPDISPLEISYKGDEHFNTKIDINKYLLDPSIKFKSKVDGAGLYLDVDMFNYHFYSDISNTNLTVLTEAGSNYLLTHRAQIEAAKTGAKLNRDMELKQLSANKFNNTISLFTDIINPKKWLSDKSETWINSEKVDYTLDNYQNELATINGTIADNTAAPPSSKGGSGSGWSLASNYAEKGIFTYKLREPSNYLQTKIINYHNRYGYKFDHYLTVDNIQNTKWWEVRSICSYWQSDKILEMYKMPQLENYIPLDPEILELFNKEFTRGVRLWKHFDKMIINTNYDWYLYNLEQSLFDYAKAKGWLPDLGGVTDIP